MSKPIATFCNDGCEKNFTIKRIRNRKTKNGIEKNYFICPHCKREYVAFYASKETIQLQKDMRRLHVSMRGVMGNDLTTLTHKETILKVKIKQSMDEARAVVEG